MPARDLPPRPWAQSTRFASTDRDSWRFVAANLTPAQRDALEAKARELGIPVSPPATS